METLANNTLKAWREEGRQLIQQNYEVFRNLLTHAKDLVQRGEYDAAAVYCQIAANHAQVNHCGFFASRELEQILIAIGQTAIPKNIAPRTRNYYPERPKNVLHVSTYTSSIGGIPRFLWRWIQQDTERSHSVALIRQAPMDIPKNLSDAVFNSQGKIYKLSEKIGGIISLARRLRECAKDADLVVLHTWEFDVVPTIAFANKEQSPPIIYTNHGDHWFWVGTSISDVVANLRESGMRLSHQRRGIEANRNLLLPTILEPSQRNISRAEAKQQLGIDKNNVMLLSVARAVKYRMIEGISFADAHVPLLNKYKQTILVVIGPSDSDEDWSDAIKQTQGRIRVLGETKDTAIFYQAADIYVDSFPFVSITSILEAGSYGVPSVSRYPYSSDACEILGADMPGLTGNLIRVQDIEEYTTVLSRLVEDKEFRLSLGKSTKSKIEATHWGDNWQSILNNVYYHAATLSRVTLNPDPISDVFLGEPDVFLPSIHGIEIDRVIQWHLPLMPLGHRLRLWLKLFKKYGFCKNPLNLLIPEGLRSRYYLLRSQVSYFNWSPLALIFRASRKLANSKEG